MFCRNCGSEVSEKAIACPKCGVPPLSEKKFCQECGGETKANQMVCVKCGVKLLNKGSGSPLGANLNIDTSKLNIDLGNNTKLYRLGCAILMFVMIFIPFWLGGGGYHTNGLISRHGDTSVVGVFEIIFSLACIGVLFINFKWTFILGLVNFILAWIFLLGHESSYWSLGGFIFMAFAIIYSVLTYPIYKES